MQEPQLEKTVQATSSSPSAPQEKFWKKHFTTLTAKHQEYQTAVSSGATDKPFLTWLQEAAPVPSSTPKTEGADLSEAAITKPKKEVTKSMNDFRRQIQITLENMSKGKAEALTPYLLELRKEYQQEYLSTEGNKDRAQKLIILTYKMLMVYWVMTSKDSSQPFQGIFEKIANFATEKAVLFVFKLSAGQESEIGHFMERLDGFWNLMLGRVDPGKTNLDGKNEVLSPIRPDNELVNDKGSYAVEVQKQTEFSSFLFCYLRSLILERRHGNSRTRAYQSHKPFDWNTEKYWVTLATRETTSIFFTKADLGIEDYQNEESVEASFAKFCQILEQKMRAASLKKINFDEFSSEKRDKQAFASALNQAPYPEADLAALPDKVGPSNSHLTFWFSQDSQDTSVSSMQRSPLHDTRAPFSPVSIHMRVNERGEVQDTFGVRMNHVWTDGKETLSELDSVLSLADKLSAQPTVANRLKYLFSSKEGLPNLLREQEVVARVELDRDEFQPRINELFATFEGLRPRPREGEDGKLMIPEDISIKFGWNTLITAAHVLTLGQICGIDHAHYLEFIKETNSVAPSLFILSEKTQQAILSLGIIEGDAENPVELEKLSDANLAYFVAEMQLGMIDSENTKNGCQGVIEVMATATHSFPNLQKVLRGTAEFALSDLNKFFDGTLVSLLIGLAKASSYASGMKVIGFTTAQPSSDDGFGLGVTDSGNTLVSHLRIHDSRLRKFRPGEKEAAAEQYVRNYEANLKRMLLVFEQVAKYLKTGQSKRQTAILIPVTPVPTM